MRTAIITSVLVAFFVIGFLLFADTLDEWIATEKGLRWLEEQGPLAGIAAVALIASDLFLPMPVSGVLAALGTIYGGFVGGLYGSAGCIAGGLLAYGLVRAMGRRAAARIAGEENLVSLERFFTRGGTWAIAMTRVLPVVSEVLCCLAGLAPMPFGRFFVALCCGSVPFSFMFTFYASTADQEPLTAILIAILVPALLLLPAWLVFERVSRRP